LIDGEGFWSFIDERIRELDDARLTIGVGRKIRSRLPVALLSVNAKLSMSAAELQQWGEAERQLGIIRASGFAEDQINEALQNVLTPVCERIRTYCQDCKQQASADVDHANDVAERLLSRATPGLEILDRLLSANQPIRVSVRDEVALAALEALIGFGNKTKKWGETLALLERVRSVAVSQSVCGRIDENLVIIRGNAEQNRVWGTCWFCGTEAADENRSVKYSFHKVISRVANIIRYQQMSITVPRCVCCAEATARAARFDDKRVLFVLAGGAMGLVAGIGAYRMFAFVTGLDFLSFLLLVSCVAGYGYLAKLLVHDNFGHEALPPGIKPTSSYREFPPIKELFASGWSSGETPPTPS